MNIFAPHATDGYKTGHRKQYPPGTQLVYSNWTCRGDAHAKMLSDFDHKVVFFGLQAVCQWLLIDTWDRSFFGLSRDTVVARYTRRMDGYLGAGAVGADHIAALHDLGYLPLRIKAVPEGSRVDIRVPMFTIENTHPDFAWLTNYVETQLSAELWKPMTTATTAFEYRRLFHRMAVETGGDPAFALWQGHDFSFRGMSGIHDAMSSGAAHLLSFTGTDTIPAIDFLEEYYSGAETFVGGSVPATEHSVMCMGGHDDEVETFRRLIHTYPSGIVSIVSDTWDFWKVMTEFTVKLKDEILARDGKVVFRPDSGDPVDIICGVPDRSEFVSLMDMLQAGVDVFHQDGHFYKVEAHNTGAAHGPSISTHRIWEPTPAQRGAIQCLWDVFGGTETSTGHRQLDSHVGLIYGDSITLDRAERILKRLAAKGFASTNVVLGIGSYTYQYVTRDTFGTAIKATYGVVNGEERVLQKDPKTDSGVKKSAAGLIRVEKTGFGFHLLDRQTREQANAGVLEVVFENGQMKRHQTLADIRAALAEHL
jgi:nicotinamide phosphoribosyltransferase